MEGSCDESDRILTKIEQLLKLAKFQDHLAQHVDEYMECIEELTRGDDFGITTINFVKVSRFIENATRVYAINVDCLCQYMNDVLEVLRLNKRAEASRKRVEAPEENEEPTENQGEGAPKKRKKRVTFEDFEEIQINVIDPDMKASARNDTIKLLPVQRHITNKMDWKRRKRSYQIHDMDGDTVVLSDYSVMFQTSGKGKLQMNMLRDLMNEESEERNYNEYVTEIAQVLELMLREMTTDADIHSDDEEEEEDEDVACSLLAVEEIENPMSVDNRSDVPTEPMDCPPSPVSEPLPITRSLSPCPIKRSLSDVESDREVCAGGLQASGPREREHLVTVTNDPADPWAPFISHSIIKEKPLKKRQSFKAPGDMKLSKQDEKRRKSGNEEHEKVELVVEFIESNLICTFDKDAFHLEELKFLHQEEEKHRKQLLKDQKQRNIDTDVEELRRLLSEDCEEDFNGFEDYEPDIGEEAGFRGYSPIDPAFRGFSPIPADDDDDDDDNDNDNDNVNVNENNNEIPENVNISLPVEIADHSYSRRDDNSQLGLLDSVSESSNDVAAADIVRRVAEWERYIRPKLKVAQNRGHFDIHGFGTEVLTAFPQTSEKSTLSFQKFVADKPTVDIPRYFLATLQLANTYNVEISKSSKEVMGMDCMNLTLLSSVRHHEALEDYEAPSTGAKRKRSILQASRHLTDSDSESESTSDEEEIFTSSRNKHKRSKR